MMIRPTTTLGGCSVRFIQGFNTVGALPTRPSVSELRAAAIDDVAMSVRSILSRSEFECYGRLGPEILIGHESNSRNPNKQTHHKYSRHAGHYLKWAVEYLGFGRVHLSPWSSGHSGSTSQIRTVTWDVLNKEEIKARVEELKAAVAEGQESSPEAERFLKQLNSAERW